MPVKKRRSLAAKSVRVCTLVVTLVVATVLGFSGCGQPDAPAENGTEEELPGEEESTPSVEWAADGVITAGEYSGQMDKGMYRLYWSRLDDVLQMGIRAETEGWVAVGIQPGSAMQDADIIIGFVADAQVTLEDHYSTGRFGPHRPDTEQGGTNDILAFGGSEADGFTVIEFSRKLDTGDEYDNPLTVGTTNAVIWAYGTADNTSLQHAPRGYGEVTP